MRQTNPYPGQQLARTLQSLGVRFLLDDGAGEAPAPLKPARLIAALAQSDESRLRLALIPLFLEHPQYAAHVCAAARRLPPPARLTLHCYYSAAVWLQQSHLPRLQAVFGPQPRLPDLFSGELGFTPGPDPLQNLTRLAERQQTLSGAPINWLGTYQHAVQVWLKGLEIR